MRSVENGQIAFKLEDGRKTELGKDDPQLRHLDHAWASTVDALMPSDRVAAQPARHRSLAWALTVGPEGDEHHADDTPAYDVSDRPGLTLTDVSFSMHEDE